MSGSTEEQGLRCIHATLPTILVLHSRSTDCEHKDWKNIRKRPFDYKKGGEDPISYIETKWEHNLHNI